DDSVSILVRPSSACLRVDATLCRQIGPIFTIQSLPTDDIDQTLPQIFAVVRAFRADIQILATNSQNFVADDLEDPMAKISASLPDELKARLDAYIQQHTGTGVSDVVQQALEQFLTGGTHVEPPVPPVTPPTRKRCA
ncbi:MAG: hypothetical protein ACAI34_21005, partial [Verrucomicrobium sp.]